MGEAWGREILCSSRCPKDCHAIATCYKSHPVQSSLAAGDPQHSSLCLTLQYRLKKAQNRTCSSWSAWLTSFELTCCRTWDMKSLLEGQPAVIYQITEVLFPLQSEHSVPLRAFGAGAALCMFLLLPLYVIEVLVQDSTQNFSKFPECWFVFPHPCNKASQAKGFLLHAPQCLTITLNS